MRGSRFFRECSSKDNLMSDTKFLNGLRAIAAFSVLFCHCIIWSGLMGEGHIAGIPGIIAKMAVDLFMLISGFLMANNMHNRAPKEPPEKGKTWLVFYIRRFFRIAPAYYLSLLIAVLFQDAFLEGYQTLADHVPRLRDTIYNAKDRRKASLLAAVQP